MQKTGGATGSHRDQNSRRGSAIDFSTSINYGKQGTSEGDKNNLWQTILNDVAQRDDIKESHLLILGDKGAGKRSLI